MCIIIAKDKDVAPLSRDNFDRAWDHNSDGGGVVWREPDGTVKIQKGIMEKEKFLALLDKVNTEDRAYIAHFRIRSVGVVTPSNCHPFVMDHVTFAHNGTLSITPLEGKTDSETFGLTCLKDKSLGWIKENQKLIEMALGTSKFAFMDNDTGEIFILNRQNGKERDGCWFSNASADKPLPVRPTRTTGYGYEQLSMYSTHGDVRFGTKQYSCAYAVWDNSRKVWMSNYDKKPKALWYFKMDITENRRGLLQIAPYYKPSDFLPEDAKKKTYTNKSKEIRELNKLNLRLERGLTEYRKTTFPDWHDKDDAENTLGAMHLVINGARRLIGAGYELNDDNLDAFILGSLETKDSYHSAETAKTVQVEAWYHVMALLDALDGGDRLSGDQ